MNFRDNCVVLPDTGLGSIGVTSTIFSGVIDMRDAEGAVYIFRGSTDFEPVNTKTMYLRVQGSTDSAGTFVNMGSTTVIAVTSGAKGRNTAEGKTVFLDVYKPDKEYIRFAITNTSGLGLSGTVIKYGVRRPGATSLYDSTLIDQSALLVGPST